MTLRLRMTLVLVAIVAVGLLAADVITYTTLHSYLTGQVDTQLTEAVTPIGRELVHQVTANGGLVQPEYNDPIVPPGTFAELRDQGGTVLAMGGLGYGTGPSLPAALPGSGLGNGNVLFLTTTGRSEAGTRTTYRVEAEAVAVNDEPFGTIVVAIPLTATQQTIGRLLLVEGLVTTVLLIALAALSWWIVRRELRPLDDMATTAGQIAAGDLSQRVSPEDAVTEVGRLGLALNTMLGEIEEAFDARRASEDRLRRFLADASHELRTPLTSIRGYAEIFDRGARDRPGDLETSMHHIRSEAGRMSELVDDLLLLARLDQERPVERKRVDLRTVAEAAVGAARVAAPGRTFALVAPTPVLVLGDASRLRQVVDNLLANAVRHTPPDGPVEVRAWCSGEAAILDVIDHGPGIAPEDRDKIFEPFHRADPSRARATGGVGLGLAIVLAIAAAHDGEVGVVETHGGGATFWVRLPLAPTTAPATAPTPAGTVAPEAADDPEAVEGPGAHDNVPREAGDAADDASTTEKSPDASPRR